MENVMNYGFVDLSAYEMVEIDGGREEGGMHKIVYKVAHAVGTGASYTVGFFKDSFYYGNWAENWVNGWK